MGQVAYKLELPPTMSRVHPVFHVSLLEPFYARKSFKPLPPPIEIEDEYEYEVEAIMDKRTRRVGRRVITQYLIKWSGYGHEHNSWEPAANLTHCSEMLQAFERAQSLEVHAPVPVGQRRRSKRRRR